MRIEDSNQKALITWFNMQYPYFKDFLVAVRNEAKRTPGGHINAIQMGLKQGFPDLMLLIPRKSFHGLCIEMKSPKGRCTPKQKRYHEALPTMGYSVAVCYSWLEGKKVIEDYLSE